MINLAGVYYCPRCHEVRNHPQPFQDGAGRVLCGACWFMDGQEVELVPSKTGFPPWMTLFGDGETNS